MNKYEHTFNAPRRLKGYSLFLVLFFVLAALVSYYFLFSAPNKNGSEEIFTVSLFEGKKTTVDKLKEKDLIRSEFAARIVMGILAVEPGGYKLNSSMNLFQLSRALKDEPYMKWVVIREGVRKEEIAEILVNRLSWSDEWEARFIEATKKDEDYSEGVYFPDTYLIPIDEEPEQVAERMIRRFDTVYAEFAEEARVQNIRWPTAVKIASLVQREAAGQEDMPIIAGIIWNRLLNDMKLDIDATLQYIKGNEEAWWPKVLSEDKRIDSPFNTYMYKGLPPAPISNPGASALGAVIYPEETDCFYYLHAPDRKIYCAVTYDEHLENIEKYLR